MISFFHDDDALTSAGLVRMMPKIIFCNTWTDTWVHKCDQKQIHRVAFRTKLQFFYRCILRRYHQFWDTWDYIFCTIYYLLLVSIWRIPCTGGCLQDPKKASEFAKTNGEDGECILSWIPDFFINASKREKKIPDLSIPKHRSPALQ